jgi:hypothetical protein
MHILLHVRVAGSSHRRINRLRAVDKEMAVLVRGLGPCVSFSCCGASVGSACEQVDSEFVGASAFTTILFSYTTTRERILRPSHASRQQWMHASPAGTYELIEWSLIRRFG